VCAWLSGLPIHCPSMEKNVATPLPLPLHGDAGAVVFGQARQ